MFFFSADTHVMRVQPKLKNYSTLSQPKNHVQAVPGTVSLSTPRQQVYPIYQGLLLCGLGPNEPSDFMCRTLNRIVYYGHIKLALGGKLNFCGLKTALLLLL